MRTTAEKIAVMQAYERGEKIQAADSGSGEWHDWVISATPPWSWMECDYRVRPKPLESWLAVNKSGVVVGCFTSKNSAELNSNETFRVVHVREVTP